MDLSAPIPQALRFLNRRRTVLQVWAPLVSCPHWPRAPLLFGSAFEPPTVQASILPTTCTTPRCLSKHLNNKLIFIYLSKIFVKFLLYLYFVFQDNPNLYKGVRSNVGLSTFGRMFSRKGRAPGLVSDRGRRRLWPAHRLCWFGPTEFA